MMMSNDPFILKLMSSLDLPQYTTEFELHVRVGEVVGVTATYHPTLGDPATITEHFTLVHGPKPPPRISVSMWERMCGWFVRL